MIGTEASAQRVLIEVVIVASPSATAPARARQPRSYLAKAICGLTIARALTGALLNQIAALGLPPGNPRRGVVALPCQPGWHVSVWRMLTDRELDLHEGRGASGHGHSYCRATRPWVILCIRSKDLNQLQTFMSASGSAGLHTGQVHAELKGRWVEEPGRSGSDKEHMMMLEFKSSTMLTVVALLSILAASAPGQIGTWERETVFTADPGDSLGIASIVTHEEGSQIVVDVAFEHMVNSTPALRKLYWSRRLGLNNWSSPCLISDATPDPAGGIYRNNYLPSITVDGAGNPIITFRFKSTAHGKNMLKCVVLENADCPPEVPSGTLVDAQGGANQQGASSVEFDGTEIQVAFRASYPPNFGDDLMFNRSDGGSLFPGWDTEPACNLTREQIHHQDHMSLALRSDRTPVVAAVIEYGQVGDVKERIGVFFSETPCPLNGEGCCFTLSNPPVYFEDPRDYVLLSVPKREPDHPSVHVHGLMHPNKVIAAWHEKNPASEDETMQGIQVGWCTFGCTNSSSWVFSSPSSEERRSVHPSVTSDLQCFPVVVYQEQTVQDGPMRVMIADRKCQTWRIAEVAPNLSGYQSVTWAEPAIHRDANWDFNIVFTNVAPGQAPSVRWARLVQAPCGEE